MEKPVEERDLVFSLDIGTRNVVGTVGYKDDEDFIVVAHCNMEHETRSMLDGQIHDIGRVGKTIQKVKAALEAQGIGQLSDVCIAAAGRVLKTEKVCVEYVFPEEKVVEKEDVHSLDLLGVEKAQNKLNDENDTKFKFYCVGYSVVKYFFDDDPVSNLVGHKARKISEEVIATFLPEDVVDGLYMAVGEAGLNVANLTLEPIAAINVAIPENFRLLNIALVDVGAGTSDISITKEGSIIAYGMIPHAGDELTEIIVQHYLVDFKTAEYIKLHSTTDEEVTFNDIMLLPHTIPSSEVWELVKETTRNIAAEVAKKIIELNGDKPVSACFVVGGGGKIHGFTEYLAEELDIMKERVALRGEEVMQRVFFRDETIKKDPLLVTPIGICLNYYEQKNNFVYVNFNGERMKLYDNNKLTVMDAALAAGFPTEELFPRRGTEINYFVNGKPRMIRGEAGEPAIIKLNGQEVSLSAPIAANAKIEIISSTIGTKAQFTIENIKEYTSDDITFVVNGRNVACPKFVEVNGILEPSNYIIQEGDRVELRNYYTVSQLIGFMDVQLEPNTDIFVNNEYGSTESLVYENFSVKWTLKNGTSDYVPPMTEDERIKKEYDTKFFSAYGEQDKKAEDAKESDKNDLPIYINGEKKILTGHDVYLFLDIFEVIDFDVNEANGRTVATLINGETATYTQKLSPNDRVEIYWKEK